MPFGSSAAVSDETVLSYLACFRPNFIAILNDTHIVEQFCQRFKSWIFSSNSNNFKGIEDFKFSVYSNATSESFDKFYMRNHKRRFRCLKGEYVYHQIAWRNSWPDWRFIEDEDLHPNDAVVLSYPFADTGNKHSLQDEILKKCSDLGIPLLMDCVYLGVSSGLEFDFSYPCITDITFSLSKIFPIANARVGLRLTRGDDDDTMFVYQKISYNNRLSAALGDYFINEFPVDYIVNKYKSKQIRFCSELSVVPSHTVFFAVGGKEWQQYNRGGCTNRLSFHKFLHLDSVKEHK